MASLPPLTEKIGRGAAGGHEFEHLLHQLLLRFADEQRFVYEPVHGAGGDGGVDGIVTRGGVPGLEGPVAFQFKWLWDDIHKGNNARQIRDALRRAEAGKAARHWVLVTPWDLKPSERAWLEDLGRDAAMEVHAWGQERIESLLRGCPELFARYYPDQARALIEGFDGLDFAGFATEYRKAVARAHEIIRTLGLPTKVKRERDAGMRIPLRNIFVPLRFQIAGREGEAPLASVLAADRSRVVLGDPGTGKSTLLARLSLLYAAQESLDGYEAPAGKVPLFISLRDFARAQQVTPGLSFVSYLAAHARSDLGLAHAHSAFFESALRMGEAVVLLDGLDEVGREAARHRVARAVRAFHDRYRTCTFWVTSRIYGYTRDVELPSADFDEIRIARLDDAQVSDFVGRWYAIQEPNNPRQRDELAGSLRHAVQRSPSVRRLAGNPLLLTLMAFLHQSLRRLPRERGELYELCIDMLLRTWPEARQGEGPQADAHPFEKLGLHVATQKDYLAHLALFVQERNEVVEGEDARGLVGHVEALERLARRHLERSRRTRPGLDHAEAREEMDLFLDYLGDRTGLLVNRGNDKLAFLHLSFQEYLAAWVFLCGPGGADPGFFVKYLGAPAWEEVLLLRLYIVLREPGGGGEEAFDRIVRALLDRLGAMSFEAGWQMLARGVRDELAFTPADREAILRKAVELWARDGRFEGEWFGVLEEICLFAEQAREGLRGVLATAARERPERAEGYGRLEVRLFGTDEERAAVEAVQPAPLKERELPPDVENIGTITWQGTTPGEVADSVARIKASQQRVPEVIITAHRGGELNIPAAEEVLDDLEASLGLPQPQGSSTIVGRALIYSETIGRAFNENAWSELDMRAFADAVLDRVTRSVVEIRDTLMDATLRLLGAHAARAQLEYILPATPNVEHLVNKWPVTRVWTYLRSWAGVDSRRRGQHARAVRHALCEMHDRGGGGFMRCLPMMLGVREIIDKDPSAVVIGAEMQSLQILSATWQDNPLRGVSFEIVSQQSKKNYRVNLEEIVTSAARLLSDQPSSIMGNEQWWSFPYQVSSDEVSVTFSMPPEAILLRARPGAISKTAPSLALAQGPHDGRAYAYLRELAAHSDANEVQAPYARMTVLAPWRLVREDPTYVRSFRWSIGTNGIFETFPASLDDLREMLSEPPGALVVEQDFSLDIAGRISGIWSQRLDYFELMRMACAVPGFLPSVFMVLQMNSPPDAFTQEVRYALHKLERPQDVSGAQIAADIFFLRMAAAHKPVVRLPEGEVDLRERLPGLLVDVLKDVVRKDPNPDTLAVAEAPLLRLCAQVVENLRGPDSLALLDRLWLTYRLFQWLNLQLDRMPNDARILGLRALREAAPSPRDVPPDADLLDPFRFDRARFDHRLAAVTYALSAMENLPMHPPAATQAGQQVRTKVSSPELEQLLAKLSARALTQEELVLRHNSMPSCLGWGGLSAIPDLALWTLLQLNEDGFFAIEPESRLRLLQDLPGSPDDQSHLPWVLVAMVVLAASDRAHNLSLAERVTLEESLRALDPSAQDAPYLLWAGLSGLYEAGVTHLEHEVVDLLEKNLAEPNAPMHFGRYLTALSRLAPDKLVPEAERILAAVEAGGVDPIPVASALARPIIAGAPSCVRPVKDVLRRLAARDPYRGNEEMTRLLGMLGVT